MRTCGHTKHATPVLICLYHLSLCLLPLTPFTFSLSFSHLQSISLSSVSISSLTPYIKSPTFSFCWLPLQPWHFHQGLVLNLRTQESLSAPVRHTGHVTVLLRPRTQSSPETARLIVSCLPKPSSPQFSQAVEKSRASWEMASHCGDK